MDPFSEMAKSEKRNKFAREIEHRTQVTAMIVSGLLSRLPPTRAPAGEDEYIVHKQEEAVSLVAQAHIIMEEIRNYVEGQIL